MRACRNMHLSFLAFVTFFVTASISLFPGSGIQSAFAEKRHFRLATSKQGSTGYVTGVALSACVNKYVKDVSMESVPTPGSTASARQFAKGILDCAYLSAWGVSEIYFNMGPFEKETLARKPMQGFYYTCGDMFVLTEADRKDINCLGDLVGKKVFVMIRATGWYDGWRLIYKHLGIWDKMERRNISHMEVADALKMGTIDAFGAYSVCRGEQTAGWVRNVDARTELKLVSPSPEEQKAIMEMHLPGIYKGGDLSKKWMSPKNRKLNLQKDWPWGSFQGWHPGGDTPTEVWYQSYKAWMEHMESDLADVNIFLKWLSKDPLGFQVEAIDAAREIPVHPGTAKYLKEKGLWKDHWIVGKLDPGVK